MRTYLECIPCFFRQALEAARYCTDDETLQKAIIDEVAPDILKVGEEYNPPYLAAVIQRTVREKFGKQDWYKDVKKRSNEKALALYPKLKNIVAASKDKLLTALEVAITGNIIDYAAKNTLNVEAEIEKLFDGHLPAMTKTVFDYNHFKKDFERAKNVLILGDNAGEIVFDKIFIEQIPKTKKVYYAVRGEPILNDATLEDARFCQMDKIAEVVSSGVDTPGTVLAYCSQDFLRLFSGVDLILSKGQGNFEALCDEAYPLYFLFKVKCSVVARNVKAQLGDIVLKKQTNTHKEVHNAR